MAQATSAHRSWLGTFFTGLLLWIASVLVTGLTSNANMIPTVILLGSFLVPDTAVIWYLDHYESDVATPAQVARAFIIGGVIGVLAASVLEALLLRNGLLVYLGVGFIEEMVKLLGLIVVARRLPSYTVRDGIVLGAAVGFGFAALESSGYAFNSLIVRQGHTIAFSLGDLVSTELLRGILAPVGHGLWTAILGGVLFGVSRGNRLHLRSRRLFGAYVLVAVLHGLWDSMDVIASLLTALFLALPTGGDLLFGLDLPPGIKQFLLTYGLYFAGLAVLALVGVTVLRRSWRAATAPVAVAPVT
jgi:RsiW-degrading membrane proteinase PrsW (M82 family)